MIPRLGPRRLSGRSHAPYTPRRTATAVEDLVLTARGDLAQADLGAAGADAMRQALVDRQVTEIPSVRTTNRIPGSRASGGFTDPTP